MVIKHYPRTYANWSYYTKGWIQSPTIVNDKWRQWIEDNIEGEWTETVFGDIKFQFRKDCMKYTFEVNDKMVAYKTWNQIELHKLGCIIVVGDAPSNMKEFIKQYKPMEKWCKENFNRKHFKIFVIDEGWHDTVYYIGYVYCFKYKADAMAFKLRWT